MQGELAAMNYYHNTNTAQEYYLSICLQILSAFPWTWVTSLTDSES